MKRFPLLYLCHVTQLSLNAPIFINTVLNNLNSFADINIIESYFALNRFLVWQLGTTIWMLLLLFFFFGSGPENVIYITLTLQFTCLPPFSVFFNSKQINYHMHVGSALTDLKRANYSSAVSFRCNFTGLTLLFTQRFFGI